MRSPSTLRLKAEADAASSAQEDHRHKAEALEVQGQQDSNAGALEEARRVAFHAFSCRWMISNTTEAETDKLNRLCEELRSLRNTLDKCYATDAEQRFYRLLGLAHKFLDDL